MSEAVESVPILELPADHPAAARSRTYALFAEALRFPQGDAGMRLTNGVLMAELAAAVGALPFRYTFVPPVPVEPEAARRTYTALFDAIGGKPQVSLLEQRYEGAPAERELWEELLRFYRYFGLDFTRGGARERPDHLLVQLEFMHYLAFLEAGAPASVQADLTRAQRDFLERHLARWLPAVHDRLTAIGDAAPYDHLTDLLVRFVGGDCAYLGAPLAGPPLPVPG